MPDLKQLLEHTSVNHSHLCPRQVLGVRMGLLAYKRLEIDETDIPSRLIVILEMDGCFVDGISAATQCTVGNRRLRILDYGKIAGTFVDLNCTSAIRIAPRRGIREAAQFWAPEARNKWQAQLEAYQVIPDELLFSCQWVTLKFSLEKLLSKPGYRVSCQSCGEEIFNQREVFLGDKILCQACAGQKYYQTYEFSAEAPLATSSHLPRRSRQVNSLPIEN